MKSKDTTGDDALPLATYAFAEFEFDARRLRLTRHGDEVTLTPKATAVLDYLVRRPDRVVSKQALLAAAWPTVVVEEGNLSQTVYLLRRALGEQPTDHRCIVTVPGRGYRFVAAVRVVEDAPVAAAPVVAEAAQVAAAAQDAHARRDARVAQAESATHGERATSAVTGVPAPPAPLAWRPRRATGWSGVALAALLGACGLVYLGNQPRPAGLTGAAIAQPAAPAPLLRPPPAVEPDRTAERDAALMRARFMFGRRADGDLQRALDIYQDLVARDANDAQAWTGIASVMLITSYGSAADGAPARDPERVAAREAARRAAQRALVIDPTSGEAHMRLATLRLRAGDPRGFQEEFSYVRRHSPDLPLLLLAEAECAAMRGDFNAAAQYARRGVEREPLNVIARLSLGTYLMLAQRLDDAESETMRAFELAPRDDASMRIGEIRLARGDVDGAARAFAALRDAIPRQQGQALLAAAARRAAATETLQRFAARFGREDPYVVAQAYALLGDRDRAFRWLERAAPSDGGRGVSSSVRARWEMRGSPLLAQLHSDPRWYGWERAMTRPDP